MTKNQKCFINQIIIKCILGIIILSLILTTVKNYIPQNIEKYIVTVNGEKIYLKTFQKNYFFEFEKQKQILGKNFLNVKNRKNFLKTVYKNTLNQLINTVLIEQYVKKLKLNMTNQEIKEIIFKNEAFRTNNMFDKKKYFNYLELINLNNEQYINIIKKKIITQKLINTIYGTNFILDHEKQDIIKLLSEKRVVKTAIIKNSLFNKKQNISEKEIYNYYNNNHAKFFEPMQFQVNCIKIQKNNLNKKDDNKKWNKNNIIQNETITKNRYSIIQVKTKKEALLILSQLKKPEDFAQIARKKSIDSSSSINGGDIGWMSPFFIPNEIKKACLTKKGQISKVIPFKKSFLIIQLSDISKKINNNLSKIYNAIKEKNKNTNEVISYSLIKNEIINILNKQPDKFFNIIKKMNIKPLETNWFNIHSIPENLNIPVVKKFIFYTFPLIQKNKLKKHVQLINLNSHTSLIIQVKNYKHSKFKKLQDVKQDIIHTLKHLKSIKDNQKYAQNIVKKLNNENKDILNKLSFNKLEIISRYNNNPITPIVFSLPYPYKNKKIYSYFQHKNGDIQIISLTKVFHEKLSKEEYYIISSYLENNNNERIFNAILNVLRARAEIIYEHKI